MSEHDERDDGTPPPEQNLTRRRALQVLGAIPIAGAIAWQQQQGQTQTPKQTHEAPNQPAANTRQPRAQPRNKFFTTREMRTVRVMADDVIPRDARSGSASEAGVPTFIDFNLSVPETSEQTRVLWRGGLRWMDTESRKRFNVAYAAATAAQRHAILDDLSWPDRVKPEHQQGAAFFARFRDMVASGFFSSEIGFRDLKYQGNTFLPAWTGCPEPALQKLGVSYDLMNKATPK